MSGVSVKPREFKSHGLIAALLIAFAIGIRTILDLLQWPPTNSDEGIMAIIANDIAYHGKSPLMFYGQHYMGVLEAYLGALFYHLAGGPSIAALRLGVILLIGLFFVVVYRLTSIIYSKDMALVTLAMMSVGSIPYLSRQTLATGGSAETLLFGSLAFLIATLLSISYDRQASVRRKLLRLPGYACFGIVVGLGIWSDMVGLPLYAMATLLLLINCWRDIFIWGGWFAGLLGGAIGLLPTIIYALTTNIPEGKNPLGILFGMAAGTPTGVPPEQLSFWHKLVETFQVSLPTATSSPFCPVIEYPFMGDNTPRSLICGIIQSSWSIGYLLLIIASVTITILALKQLSKNKAELEASAQHKLRVIFSARLCMLGAALLAIIVYINSSGPINQPGYHARYIVSLVAITPVILAPLWYAAQRLRPEGSWARFRWYGSRIILAVIAISLIAGTCIAVIEVPRAQATNSRRQHLIEQLTALHVSYLYTDYWTCYNLIVATMNTKHPITCAVIDDKLSNRHNRIKSYQKAVDKSKRPPFMCAKDLSLTTKDVYNCLPSITALARETNHKIGPYFVRHDLDGYVMYRAEPKS